MTGQYAKDTTVPVERSRAEIESTLARYGATSFAYGWDQRGAVIQFAASGRQVRFVLPLPDREAKEFTHVAKRANQHTPAEWHRRTPADAAKAWEQACRQRWRALGLAIKAKLEAVEVGITTFRSCCPAARRWASGPGPRWRWPTSAAPCPSCCRGRDRKGPGSGARPPVSSGRRAGVGAAPWPDPCRRRPAARRTPPAGRGAATRAGPAAPVRLGNRRRRGAPARRPPGAPTRRRTLNRG